MLHTNVCLLNQANMEHRFGTKARWKEDKCVHLHTNNSSEFNILCGKFSSVSFWVRKMAKKNLCTSVYVFKKTIFKLGTGSWESLHTIIQPTKYALYLLIRKFQVRFLPRDVFIFENYLWPYFTFDLLHWCRKIIKEQKSKTSSWNLNYGEKCKTIHWNCSQK